MSSRKNKKAAAGTADVRTMFATAAATPKREPRAGASTLLPAPTTARKVVKEVEKPEKEEETQEEEEDAEKTTAASNADAPAPEDEETEQKAQEEEADAEKKTAAANADAPTPEDEETKQKAQEEADAEKKTAAVVAEDDEPKKEADAADDSVATAMPEGFALGEGEEWRECDVCRKHTACLEVDPENGTWCCKPCDEEGQEADDGDADTKNAEESEVEQDNAPVVEQANPDEATACVGAVDMAIVADEGVGREAGSHTKVVNGDAPTRDTTPANIMRFFGVKQDNDPQQEVSWCSVLLCTVSF